MAKTNQARTQEVLFGLGIILGCGWFVAGPLARLFVEYRISSVGFEAPATILKVKEFERDNGEQAWFVNVINYSFETVDGYQISGAVECNRSVTEKLIGVPDEYGIYHAAVVEYVRHDPEWHRLKGWGYENNGPPGGKGSLIVRILVLSVILLSATVLSYQLLLAPKPQSVRVDPYRF